MEESVKDSLSNKYISYSKFQDTEKNQKAFEEYYRKKNFSETSRIPISKLKKKDNSEVKELEKELKENFLYKEKTSIVSIDSKDRNKNFYPDPNFFEIFLGRRFTNVSRIELVSTEFPNTDNVIKDSPLQLKNNLIAWQNEEDLYSNFYYNCEVKTILQDFIDIKTPSEHNVPIGKDIQVNIFNSKKNSDVSLTYIIDGERIVKVVDETTLRFRYIGGISEQGTCDIDLGLPVYKVEIKEGNYSARTLVQQISSDMRKVKRNNYQGQFHYFDVSVNLQTDIISFDSVITFQLTTDSISLTIGSSIVNVFHSSHGFKTGDRVKMINIKTFGGISSSELNGDFIVNVIDFNNYSYEVQTRAVSSGTGGGNSILAGKPSPFRLLFDTEDTLIQENTGFPDENSSESVNNVDCISTKNLQISQVSIIDSQTTRIKTQVNHGLYESNIINVSSITAYSSSEALLTLSSNHGLTLPTRIILYLTNSVPKIDGNYVGFPSSQNTLILSGVKVFSPGNTGQVYFDGDLIKIFGLSSIPTTLGMTFPVKNIPALDEIDINFSMTQVNVSSIVNASIGTEQINVNFPNHSFNSIVSLTNTSENYLFSCKTLTLNSFEGDLLKLVPIESSPEQNVLYITIQDHGLSVSDKIIVSNSTSIPQVEGEFFIDVLNSDTIKINFVYSSFTNGTCDITIGDRVSITKTNSVPRLDGVYYIHNKEEIASISTGTFTSNISTVSSNYWVSGDTVEFKDTNCVPELLGQYVIQNVVNDTTFTINLSSPILSAGNSGKVINRIRFKFISESIVSLDSSGSMKGIINKTDEVILYRVLSEIERGETISGIPLTAINSFPRRILKIEDTDNFVLRVDGFAEKNLVAGGNKVRISSNINGFRSIQSNTDTNEPEGKLYRSISLEGYKYIYMCIRGLEVVINSSNIKDVFAKILLSETPGLMIYNSFISEPVIFESPVPFIDNLSICIKTPEGFLFDLNDINFSFSLKITEIINNMTDTSINSYSNNNLFYNKNL